jgi:phage regulator Rha-like protein
MSMNILAAIEVHKIDGQLLVDSRLIAERLGIQHRSFYKTLLKHSAFLDNRFGRVRFEIATFETAGGSQQISFALLSEPQATFVMTLSRNTPEVIDAKADLVDAFDKAKSIIKNVIPTQNDRIRELELEIRLREAEADSARSQQRLLDTRSYIVTALPEPVQQKILGYTEVKTIEYRDRVIKDQDVVRDGNTVNKTAPCKRLRFFTKNGKPDYKRLNNFLVACNLPESAWQLTAAIQENLELTREAAAEVERRWFSTTTRDSYIGES